MVRHAPPPSSYRKLNRLDRFLLNSGDLAVLAIGKQRTEIDQYQQPLVDLADPLHVFAFHLSQFRGRFEVSFRNAQNLGNFIHHEAQDLAVDLGHDDAGTFIVLARGYTHAPAQANHRDDLPAQVNDAIDKVRHVGHASEFAQPDDLLHLQNVEAEFLVTDFEADQL